MELGSMEMDPDRTKVVFDLLRHDINNHLYGATGYIELLREHVGADAKARRYLRSSELELLAAQNLIENISALVAMRSEPFKPVPLSLSELIGKAFKANARLVGDRAFEPAVKLTPDADLVKADRFLENALVQVVLNAIRADPSERVVIEISSTRTDEGVGLIVEDHGRGMPGQMKDQSMARFTRLMEDGDYHGRGLGLSVVKAAVERCGGKVSLKDRIEGDPSKGLKVVMVLPAGDH